MEQVQANIFRWRLQSPAKLERLCLERVVDMLLEINHKKAEEDPTEWFTHIKNPFVQGGAIIIGEIIACMDFRKQILHKNVFRILLSKPIRRLELSLLHITDLQGVFDMIHETKSQLTVLKLASIENGSRFPKFPFPSLKTYLRGMDSLTHLEVKTVCDDDLLETIGANCPNLEFLEMACKLVTSRGVKSLCWNSINSASRCQSLKTVKFFEASKYLTDGLVALLLGLPELSILECDAADMGKVFQLAYKTKKAFKIQELIYTQKFYEQISPGILPSMCPNLKALTLHSLSSVDLESFPAIETLSEVKFQDMESDGVDQFLKKNGDFIRDLHFKSIPYVNYTTIDQLCKNLKKVSFKDVTVLAGIPSRNLFSKLESLALDDYRYYNPESSLQLTQLISSCHNLRHLWVSNVSWDLSKDKFLNIISCNLFQQLISIDVSTKFLSIKGETSVETTSLSPFLHAIP